MSATSGSDVRKVLFVCTHNSARSQMAEGMLRAFGGGEYEVHSAGTEATHVRPEAIEVMRELGVDISAQRSKTLDAYLGQCSDRVITVCDQANEACPAFPGVSARLHWSLPDPSAVQGDEETRRAAFRRVRDEIRERVEAMLVEDRAGAESVGGTAV